MILKKLLKLANKLDQKGLYDEASMLDKIAEEYQDHQGPMKPPEAWESAMMEMDISPEALEKEQEYTEKEIPTDPAEVEELIDRAKMLLGSIELPEEEVGD